MSCITRKFCKKSISPRREAELVQRAGITHARTHAGRTALWQRGARQFNCLRGRLEGGVGLARITGFPHSNWQIVSHLNPWIEYDLKRRPLSSGHASESWPSDPVFDPASADGNEWKREVTGFRALLGEVEVLANACSKKREEEVEAMHPAYERQSPSVLAVLWQTVVHNSYHLGQIALLRCTLGAWPPPGGGDSWQFSPQRRSRGMLKANVWSGNHDL
jgi:hypothetical protein